MINVGRWPFSDLLCKLVLYFQLLSVSASVYTLVMVTSSWRWIISEPLQSAGEQTSTYVVSFSIMWTTVALVSCIQVHSPYLKNPSTHPSN